MARPPQRMNESRLEYLGRMSSYGILSLTEKNELDSLRRTKLSANRVGTLFAVYGSISLLSFVAMVGLVIEFSFAAAVIPSLIGAFSGWKLLSINNLSLDYIDHMKDRLNERNPNSNGRRGEMLSNEYCNARDRVWDNMTPEERMILEMVEELVMRPEEISHEYGKLSDFKDDGLECYNRDLVNPSILNGWHRNADTWVIRHTESNMVLSNVGEVRINGDLIREPKWRSILDGNDVFMRLHNEAYEAKKKRDERLKQLESLKKVNDAFSRLNDKLDRDAMRGARFYLDVPTRYPDDPNADFDLEEDDAGWGRRRSSGAEMNM